MLIIQKIWLYIESNTGATAIEYGLLVAAIGLAIIAATFALGVDVNELFTASADAIESANEGVSDGS